MISIKIAVAISSLGVYATGELCVDSVLKVKTDFGSKALCDELLATDTLNCTQPSIMNHCKKSCNVSFCCADSQASFELNFTHMSRPKYKECSWKPVKKNCDDPDLFDTCPVTCGKCDPVSALVYTIDELRDEVIDQATAIVEQSTAIVEQATTIVEQATAITKQATAIAEQADQIKELETEVYDTFKHRYTYHVNEEFLTFAEHEAAAVKWGGNLASVHSAAEADYIRSLTDWYVCIGLYKNEAGRYSNTDGTKYGYNNFYPGEPNDPNNKMIVIHPHSGKFYDRSEELNTWGIYKKPNAD